MQTSPNYRTRAVLWGPAYPYIRHMPQSREATETSERWLLLPGSNYFHVVSSESLESNKVREVLQNSSVKSPMKNTEMILCVPNVFHAYYVIIR